MSQQQPVSKLGGHFIERVIANVVEILRAARYGYRQQIRSRLNFNSFRGFVSLFLVGTSLSLAIAACTARNMSSSADASLAKNKGNVELTLASFSVTKAAHDRVIPKFVEYWKKEHHQNVTINQSYAASGPQADAVVDNFEADIVHLSLAPDVEKIVKAGLIQPGWEKEAPFNAIVTKSVGVISTREGNPKNIKTWADLTKNGVKVITADPKTSGGARWNFLALWGSVIKTGGNENQALDFTTKVYKNTAVLPRSAREASDLFFKQKQGDVLINYENEVILLEEQYGNRYPYVVPDVNISIDNPVAVVDKNVDKHGTREVAEAFVKFLYTPEAQREFAQAGFRPVNPIVAKEFESKFPQVKTLFTANDFGGWDKIQNKFFNSGGVFDKIQSNKS